MILEGGAQCRAINPFLRRCEITHRKSSHHIHVRRLRRAIHPGTASGRTPAVLRPASLSRRKSKKEPAELAEKRRQCRLPQRFRKRGTRADLAKSQPGLLAPTKAAQWTGHRCPVRFSRSRAGAFCVTRFLRGVTKRLGPASRCTGGPVGLVTRRCATKHHRAGSDRTHAPRACHSRCHGIPSRLCGHSFRQRCQQQAGLDRHSG